MLTQGPDALAPQESSDGPFFLTLGHLVGVVNRLSHLLTDYESDGLEMWLLVRYCETEEGKVGRGIEPTSWPAAGFALTTDYCRDFADIFFGMPLKDSRKMFLVFKASSPGRQRWPKFKDGNGWPVQSFWQRFHRELTVAPNKKSKKNRELFEFDPLEEREQGKRTICTRRGTDGVQTFARVVLGEGKKSLNILDLAEWLARTESWDHVPDDVEVVSLFLRRIWIEEHEDVLFDEESRALLSAARSSVR